MAWICTLRACGYADGDIERDATSVVSKSVIFFALLPLPVLSSPLACGSLACWGRAPQVGRLERLVREKDATVQRLTRHVKVS